VIGIVGEPGLGKSRLLTELVQRLRGRRVTCCQGHCLPFDRTTPYLPVRDLLRDLWNLHDTASTAALTTTVHQRLQEAGVTSKDEGLLLLQLLDLPADLAALAGLSPPLRKARTFAVLRQIFRHASQRQPLLLMVENLHWIDPTSEAWLASLIERLEDMAVLLLTTYRPGYQPPWITHSAATQMALPHLSRRNSLALLQSVPQAAQLPAALQQAIVTKAAGNPFFVEELGWAAACSDALDPLPLPDTIEAVLAARLDQLPAEAKHLVQIAAVVGPIVPVPLLQRLAERPEDRLQHSLAHLQEREFLHELDLAPEQIYVFKHALTREVAYGSLLHERRRALHERTGATIELLYAQHLENHVGELAHHYHLSGNIEKAVFYYRRAGEQALQRSANPEAVQHLSTGLHLLATLPDTPARAQQELDFLIALGPALGATKGHGASEVEQTYARARALCAQIGDTPQLIPALWGLCMLYRNRAMMHTAREVAEQLHRLVRDEPALLPRLEAHVSLGTTLLGLGEYADSWLHLEQGISLIDRTAQQSRRGVPHGATCLAYAANTLWCLGFPEQALRRSREAQALAQRLDRPESLAVAHQWSAFLHYRRREVPAVQAQAEALLALARAHEFPLWRGFATCWRGWALAMAGQSQAGITQLHRGMAVLMATGEMAARPICLILLAEAVGQAGEVREGLRFLAEALTVCEASGWGDMLTEVYRLQGELLLQQAMPQTAQAAAAFQQALVIARRQQAKSWELRAALSLARLWQHQGKRDVAERMIAPLYNWFTEGDDTADLQQARALLTALSE
jgi:predicted ATPase